MATYDWNDLATGEKDNAQNVERMCKVAKVALTLDGTQRANDTVRLFTAPTNAVVTGYHIVVEDSFAGTCILDIGNATDTDGIVDGINVAAANTYAASNVANFAIGGSVVYATFKSMVTPAAGTMTIKVFYDHNT